MKELERPVAACASSEADLLKAARDLTEEIRRICNNLNFYPAIAVDDREYRIIKYKSSIATNSFFAIDVCRDDWRIRPERQGQFGGGFYLHGDFNCWVEYMKRKEWWQMVRDLPRIFVRFGEIIEKESSENVEGLIRLRRMAEAGQQ